MQAEQPREPGWVTKVFRLFPHPLFAAIIALACLTVAAIFVMVTLTVQIWPLGLVAIAFGSGGFSILYAIVLRRRFRRQDGRQTLRASAPEWVGLPPVPTSHLLLYLATILIWEARIGVFIVTKFGGLQIPAVWRYTLSVLYVVVTLLTVYVGRSDLARLRRSGGKVRLTSPQVVMLIAIFLSFGITTAMVMTVLKG